MTTKEHIFLMYCGYSPNGKVHRMWSPKEVEPVAIYRSNNQAKVFFNSFLLLAMRSENNKALIPGFGIPGDKASWLEWLDELFLPEHNLEAIAQTIKSNNLPAANIWISLPYPDTTQNTFGILADRKINFSRSKDRMTALKWWINRFLARWHGKISATGLATHLTLRGFYWPRESMTIKDHWLLPGVLAYIRSPGLNSLWIPYFNAALFLNVINPGFDYTIIQPSYMQNRSLGYKRLTEAAAKAKKFGAGIQIELDTSALYKNSEGYKTAVDYLNRGLPEHEGYMNQKLTAYYTGYKTVPELYNNKSKLYTSLYQFVEGTMKKINYPGINY
jgi:hypothetical protein